METFWPFPIYQCDQCQTVLKSALGLKRHITNTHSSEKLYKCPYCDRVFSDSANLCEHKKVHKVATCGVSRQQLMDDYTRFRATLLPHQVNPPMPTTTPQPTPPPPPVNQPPEDIVVEEGVGQIGGAVLEEADQLDLILERNRGGIRSYKRKAKVLSIANFEIPVTEDGNQDLSPLPDLATTAYEQMVTTPTKVNCSPGFILQHKTNGTFRYFHSSANNLSLFDKPRYVRNPEDFQKFISDYNQLDIMSKLIARRPNTAWRIHRLTNMTFYFYNLPNEGIGSCQNLPPHIKHNKWILSLDKNQKTGAFYEDNLCFFRALSVLKNCKCTSKSICRCRLVSELQTKILFKQWIRYSNKHHTITSFPGVTMDQLMDLQKCFQINIRIFEMREDGVGTRVWNGSSKPDWPNLNLLLHEHHVCYIKNVDFFVHHFRCTQCGLQYSKAANLKRHTCAGKPTRLKFPNGCYRPKSSIYQDILDRTGICVPSHLTFYPFRITYDIETFMEDQIPPSTSKMNLTSLHRLMSISVCSNIPGFTEPICFVSNGDDNEVVAKFVDYIENCQTTAKQQMMHSFQDIFKQLETFIEEEESVEKLFCDKPLAPDSVFKSRDVRRLVDRLVDYLSTVPVIGFNSSSYDLNVLKATLLKLFQLQKTIKFVIKRESRLQCIQTDKFKFLDMINYLTPGTSYDKYLKAYGVSMQKGFFPYEYVTSLEQLKETSLPPHQAFYSSVRGSNISEEDYKLCQRVWKENKMETLKDFLSWYNNLDVKPFLEAIEKQTTVYESKGIDMFKQHVSIPGIAVQWKFFELKDQDIDIPLITYRNQDLFKTVKDNIVGGPSIVFARYHEKDVTKLRPSTEPSPKTCQQITGFDANALYLATFMEEMPTGSPIRRKAETGFKPQFDDTYGRKAFGWLEYISKAKGIKIRHKYNDTEFRVGRYGLPVDGYCAKTGTVYQFHGCAFHGHKCKLTKHINNHPYSGISFDDLAKDTRDKDRYIRLHGFNLVTIKECEWESILKSSQETKLFVQKILYRDMSSNITMTEDQIIQAIQDKTFFGLIECDIEVPDHLRDYFSEMTPIFKNISLSNKDLFQPMKSYATENGHLNNPQRLLIGSYFGNKILLMTPLAKWYLDHGLKITKIYQIVQYKPERCFSKFADLVTMARREGDVDASKALLADISKLIGNSVYGKTITNKEKFKKVVYEADDAATARLIGQDTFVSLEPLGDDFFEIISHKNNIMMDTPVVLGFCILQYAKLRMLEFYYDCIDKYIDRSDFEYCEMDTDSAYIAFSGPFNKLIKPHLTEEFWNDYQSWFPRQACIKHNRVFINAMLHNKPWQMKDCCKQVNKFDQRTPGLFKEEFTGTGIISLNSKTYYCWDNNTNTTKSRAKGLKQKQNNLTKQSFLKVLQSKQSFTGTNTGFIRRGVKIYTYSQDKKALTYLYTKRHLLSDHVSTMPLHL